jgi:superfamily II DNA/RNA helicase
MKLKKLLPELVSEIINAGYNLESREIQSLAITKIKSGADVLMISPEDSGKSTAIAISTIQKLKRPFEEAPRAIIITSTKEKAFEMEEQIQLLGKQTKLRTFVAFDKGILQYQKDMVYEGLDILICTPKRLTELVNINGVPLTKVNLVILDDGDSQILDRNHSILYRIADGIGKVQIIVSANQWSDKFNFLSERILKNPITVSLEE